LNPEASGFACVGFFISGATGALKKKRNIRKMGRMK
jgi:hypothetical protein